MFNYTSPRSRRFEGETKIDVGDLESELGPNINELYDYKLDKHILVVASPSGFNRNGCAANASDHTIILIQTS